MPHVTRLISLAVLAIVSTFPASASAQDPVATLPDAYRLQFENEWVKVVRVKYAAGAKLAEHGHPAASLAFVYLTDAEPVVFKHSGSSNRSVTRPAVKAGSYRLARGDSEVHSVENDGGASEFLRVELKTDPAGVRSFRRRVPAPASASPRSSADVEFSNAQLRISRVRIAAGEGLDVVTTETQPALLIALGEAAMTVARASSMDVSLSPGQERWIESRQREHIANTGMAPIELLRFDFLTRPAQRKISGASLFSPSLPPVLLSWPSLSWPSSLPPSAPRSV
jgi:hypothetical protein